MSNEQRSRGLLFVVSAPSGTGKTTVVERLVQIFPDLGLSRSYTCRSKRDGEKDGLDYNFITRERFEAMIADDAFLEWADVFGNLYGTGKAETERELTGGRDLVLVIDVQGARQVRSHGANAIGIFVLPPSFEALERRLRGRSKDSEEAIRKRLATARREVRAVAEYEYVIVNDELDTCVDRLRSIVLAERARPRVMAPTVARIVASFTGKE
ncbi:MAG TPA: guanylate kinase [Vicinamibacterales bacterium]|nr:guanylate kinase [Vicinamibacterales bacterium]